ncbi:MAG: hypothetical protein WKI04_01210 [Ferruginibacter sp.]
MKLPVILFLLAFSFTSVVQDIEKFYSYDWKECEPNEARFYSAIYKTDSGYVKKDYFIHEKLLQMSGKYLDKETNVHDGYFYYFHPGGGLDAYGKYSHGKKDGLWVHYYTSGMLRDSIVYSEGHILGTSLAWHSNGYLQDSGFVNKEGKGLKLSWFDNGNISSAGFLIDHDKHTGTLEILPQKRTNQFRGDLQG